MDTALYLILLIVAGYVAVTQFKVPIWAVVLASLLLLMVYEAYTTDTNVVVDKYGGKWYKTPVETCKACPFSKAKSM